MNIAIIIGRKNSKGFPGKNLFKIYGKPIAWYPISLAKKIPSIKKVYLSTDDPNLKQLAINNRIKTINRPKYLASDKALGEDAFLHAYNHIKKIEKQKINLLILLFCNAVTINSKSINSGISFLNKNKKFDSAVTVSKYNMWSPIRARKLDKNGALVPFVDFEYFGNPKKLNCDRDSQGDVWFADMGCSIVRPSCLENIKNGLLPQKWMGRKIAPIYQECGFDIDYEWQIPMAKWWIKKYYDNK